MKDHLVPRQLRAGMDVIRLYAALTRDFNPIHVDPDFASSSPFGGIIAHGTLSLNLIWQSIEATFGNMSPGGCALAVRFRAPVHEGDMIVAGGRRVNGAGDYEVWVENQEGRTVIEGRLTFELPAAPEAAAGAAQTDPSS